MRREYLVWKPWHYLPDGIRNDFFIIGKYSLSAGILIALLSLSLQNNYSSIARVLPKDPKNGSALGNLAAAAAVLGVGGGDDSSLAYIDIMKSRWVLERLLKSKHTYSEASWYFGSTRSKTMTLKEYLQTENQDKAIGKVKNIFDIQKDPKSGLITIVVTTTSPELSQQLAHEALSLTDDYLLKHSQTQAGAKAEFAIQRLKDAREEALQAEEGFRRFLMVNRNYQSSADPSIRLTGARLEADLSLKRQIVSSLAFSREQALLEQKDNIPVLNVLDEGHLPSEKSGPPRGLMVIATILLAGFSSWAWRHRQWIGAKLRSE
jgi:uncharacterized protein involved in exopolysaccharide biosynthesis